MKPYLLAIDQGTTNSRAILFNLQGEVVCAVEKPLTQSFPQPGWVEQDGMEMVTNIIACCQQVVAKAQIVATDIAAIGLTNQRETTLLWNKKTGRPIYPAIVWQDRRTSDLCTQLRQHSQHGYILQATGLLIDPYFSALKLHWLLENVPGVRAACEKGELIFGTVDSFLIWHLTADHRHLTDASNASRTLLFNIQTQQWDDRLLSIFNIPNTILPTVLNNADDFGSLATAILGKAIPICGVAGDQQAATIGQACFQAGMMKITYGTGGFLVLNTGTNIIRSQNKLLATVAYRLKDNVTYGLEGSIFSAGETIKWLRDNIHLIQTSSETESLAASTQSNLGTYIVPAFTGLGAPYWQPQARAGIVGIERNTQREHIVRAALESVAYQTYDLLLAMQKDGVNEINRLRVDGGMTANNWLLQFLADIVQVKVTRPRCIETTAWGAALLAGLQIGLYPDLTTISQLWQVDREFYPQMTENIRQKNYRGWLQAINSMSQNPSLL